MAVIRKITVGLEYKINSMHYTVDQLVYGEHRICAIEDTGDEFVLFIQDKSGDVKEWKGFNKNMAISRENNIDFDG